MSAGRRLAVATQGFRGLDESSSAGFTQNLAGDNPTLTAEDHSAIVTVDNSTTVAVDNVESTNNVVAVDNNSITIDNDEKATLSIG